MSQDTSRITPVTPPPLHHAPDQFRLLEDQGSEYAILMLDPAGQVTTWNDGVRRIKGYTAEEVIGRHFSCFYPAEDIAAGTPDRHTEQAVTDGQVEYDGWRIRRDGSRFRASVVLTAIHDDTGELTGFVMATCDVTALRVAEEERERLLRETDRRLRELRCLHRVVEAIRREFPYDKLLEEIAQAIPDALSAPEQASAKIRFDHHTWSPDSWPDSGIELTEPIRHAGCNRGEITVAYERLPTGNHDMAFSEAERETIRSVAVAVEETAARQQRARELELDPERIGPSAERALQETRAEQKHQATSWTLRDSERRYRCLVTATSDFLWWAHPDGSIYELDPAWLAYTGYTSEQAHGWGSFQAIHSDDHDTYLAAWQEAIQSGNVFRMEYRLRRHDGAYGWFLDRAAPVLDDTSRITEWVGTSADISQRKEAEQALQASEARYRTLFEDSPNGVMIMDDLEVVDCNARAPDVFGRRREDLIGLAVQTFSPILQPNGEHSAEMARRLTGAAQTQGPQEFEWDILRTDGKRATLEVTLACVDHHLHAVIHDVTEQRAAEAEMRKLSRAVQQAAEAIVITDADRVIEYVNPAFERITSYSADEAIGKTPSFLGSNHNDSGVWERLREDLDAGQEFHGLLVNRRRSGDLYYADMSIAPIRDEAGRLSHFIGTHYDVTEQLQKEQEFARLAHFDPLTDLPNRTLMIDRLNHMLTQIPAVPGHLLVMHVDLDGFGFVNESWGHTGGDHVLKTAANRLADAAGPSATVGRVGNDGFLIAFITTASDESSDTSTTRIQHALSEPVSFEDGELRVTGTIGIAFGPKDGGSAEELMTHAEVAMQRARERGREQMAFYTPAMHEEACQWLSIQGDLRRALARDEFHLEYQPQVDLDNGRISGLEALLRWVHPVHGRIPPGDFIPQLERSGLIVGVGEWVIHEACIRIAEWHTALIGDGTGVIRVAVNLSLMQFERRDLVEVVRHTLEATGADPRCLELELTETSLARNPEEATRTLHALRDLGVTVALDDFGTGYSSLNYLKRFPIDSVKIDRVFIDGVTHDPGDAAILRAVLAMAGSRHMKAVAEGVETEGQVRFLRAEGCRNVQGFYFAAAMAADEIQQMLVDSWRFDISPHGTDTLRQYQYE